MNLFSKCFTLMMKLMFRNPSTVAGVSVFGLAFALVAGNALYSQSSTHPDPIWETRDMALTRSIKVENKPVSITSTVLTQSYSLKNIPVPTMRPIKRAGFSNHSSIVRDVQAALAGIGFYNGKIDGIYGSETSDAIIAFQEQAGILPDGEASYGLLSNVKSASAVAKVQNAKSQNARPQNARLVENPVETVITQTAAKQPTQTMVSLIQRGLNEFGFEEIDVDGVMGNQTRKAIRDFQKQFKLSVTGEPDKDLVNKLVEIGILSNT